MIPALPSVIASVATILFLEVADFLFGRVASLIIAGVLLVGLLAALRLGSNLHRAGVR